MVYPVGVSALEHLVKVPVKCDVHKLAELILRARLDHIFEEQPANGRHAAEAVK